MKPIVVDNVMLWNLDYSVGKKASNSNAAADVSFVQWMFALGAHIPQTSPERRRVYANVRVTGSCRGTDDDPLVQAIRIYQSDVLKHRDPDGRCSVANATGHYGAGYLYTIMGLCWGTSHTHQKWWPRMDLHPSCPPNVAMQIRQGCLAGAGSSSQVG